MRLPRPSIARLMGFVLVAALALVGLMRPDPLWASLTFTTSIVILAAAILNAAYGSGRSRPFWVGFAVAGWIYLLVAFGTGTGEVGPPTLIVSQVIERFQILVHPGAGPIYTSFTPYSTMTANGSVPTLISTVPATPMLTTTISPPATPAVAASPTIEDTEAGATIAAAEVTTPEGSPTQTTAAVPPAPSPPVSVAPAPAPIAPGGVVSPSVDAASLYQIGHSLTSLLAGLLGGYYALFVAGRRDRAALAAEVSPSSP